MSLNQNSKSKTRLGVLLSGRGSNFKAIQKAIASGQLTQAEIALVVSNHPEAEGIAFAHSQGFPTLTLEKQQYENRIAFDQALTQALLDHQVDLVILAGYDRILTASLLTAYAGRILNIHPSLLPAYGGKGMLGPKVHQAVLDNLESESGCSVHLVTEVVDGGAILGQSRVSLLPDDTAETLAARILEQEHELYPRMIGEFIQQHFMNQAKTEIHHEPETLPAQA